MVGSKNNSAIMNFFTYFQDFMEGGEINIYFFRALDAFSPLKIQLESTKTLKKSKTCTNSIIYVKISETCVLADLATDLAIVLQRITVASLDPAESRYHFTLGAPYKSKSASQYEYVF